MSWRVVESVEEVANEMAKVLLEAGWVFDGEDAAEAVNFAWVILCEGIEEVGESIVAWLGR